MRILERQEVGPYTTFGLPATARYYARAGNEDDLIRALAYAADADLPLAILGGGSNTLFTKDFPGLVIHMDLRGIQDQVAGADFVRVRAAAGEDWASLVDTCLQRGWFGLENLALIPGTAGAAPVQNIGAYGLELAGVLESVELIDRRTGERESMTAADCQFGYRDSIFKRDAAQQLVITAITLRLSTVPRVCLAYAALRDALAERGIAQPQPLAVAKVVCDLRRARLPDPAVLGNAGSFFKNPIVSQRQAEALAARHPGLIRFPASEGRVKLAAGWLIDRCGFKGQRRGRVGVHTAQALVLVNHGGATAAELLALVDEIRTSVAERFELQLEIEPRLL